MKSDSESESETETAPADKESLDADELVEENFRQAGITKYEKNVTFKEVLCYSKKGKNK